MAQAASRPASKKTPKPAPAQFTFTLGVTEAQALLAIVGLTRGRTLGPLYRGLESFHEEHDIDRKEAAEHKRAGQGFNEDALIDWWTAHDEAVA
jgi:hypothetical protein